MAVVNTEGGLINLPIIQKQSALEDPQFQNVKNKVQSWLKTKSLIGFEMDNVFFGNDRFELMVDTRGYRPEELKCTVGPNTIEITAQKQEVSAGAQRILETARSYQLPQLVVPQQAVCCLSSEGLLLIVVPWQK